MNDALAALAAEYHDYQSEQQPTKAHLEGDYRWADRFEEASVEAENRQIASLRQFAVRAEAIPATHLSADERITREMLAWDATTRADILESRLDEFSVDPVSGVQAALAVIPPMLSLPTATIAEQMIPKYRGLARYFRQAAERHHLGVVHGRTPARFAVEQVIEQLDELLATPLNEDPLLKLGPTVGVDRDTWLADLGMVIQDDVRPAMAAFRDVLRSDVLPASRPDDRVGLKYVAGGDEAYARLVSYYTTTALTPQEIHGIGLRQIESLAGEYRQLGPRRPARPS
jgi:uncharacterized protein (DUF885 family)